MTARLARITVSLCVSAPKSVDLSQITAFTGVEPTRVWSQKNDMIAAEHPELDNQEWEVELPGLDAGDFDQAIQAVLERIWHARDQLVQFCRANRARVSIHLMPLAGPDVIVFAIDDPETIRRVAFLDGRIHFHMDYVDG